MCHNIHYVKFILSKAVLAYGHASRQFVNSVQAKVGMYESTSVYFHSPFVFICSPSIKICPFYVFEWSFTWASHGISTWTSYVLLLQLFAKLHHGYGHLWCNMLISWLVAKWPDITWGLGIVPRIEYFQSSWGARKSLIRIINDNIA